MFSLPGKKNKTGFNIFKGGWVKLSVPVWKAGGRWCWGKKAGPEAEMVKPGAVGFFWGTVHRIPARNDSGGNFLITSAFRQPLPGSRD